MSTSLKISTRASTSDEGALSPSGAEMCLIQGRHAAQKIASTKFAQVTEYWHQ
jgi:hypothetical protein